MPTGRERDTDADWRLLGQTEPYWGVISQPEFRRENVNDEAVERFYAGGRAQMAQLVERLEAATGVRPGGRALDFGCGVGRLAAAMCDYAETVTGYDISPGMLERARVRGGCVTYVDALPEGPFDWINSYIVFQHIEPQRGLELIEALMARLAPGGHVALQLTIWRDARHPAPAAPPPAPAGWRRWLGRASEGPPGPPPGTIMMYDYDLSQVLKRLHSVGCGEMKLFHTDHGGHHGVEIFTRRTAA
jgi:SAM-dependent methyltransferase